MQEIVTLLEQEAERQELAIRKLIGSTMPFVPIVLTLRELDVYHVFGHIYRDKLAPSGLPIGMALQYGWPALLRTSCSLLSMKPGPMLFETNPVHSGWIRHLIGGAGAASFTKRVVELAKHELITINQLNETEISYRLTAENADSERFDKFDLNYVREVFITKLQATQRKELEKEWPKIQRVIRKTVRISQQKFIAYDSTQDVDVFFEKAARQHIQMLQLHEDFGDGDRFGGLPYGTYVSVLETVIAVALRHISYCTVCLDANPAVDAGTLLSHISADFSFSEDFLQRFGLRKDQMQQVFDHFTLSPENAEAYTSISGASPPPYVKVSTTQIIRTIAGCLHNPFQFLNFELRRRWPSDYFEAVNNREVRFRNELFNIFPDKRIIRIDREVHITVSKIRTDIDCILYDTKTGTLGLFQLKWQEPFLNSLKKRRNASGEFYKANKWVERVYEFIASTNSNGLLDSLQITKQTSAPVGIKNISVFVLSRHGSHFSGGQPDRRAVWGSWWQMVANLGKVRTLFDDPIRQAAVSLEFMSPEERMKREELPVSIQPPIQIGPYYLFQEGS